MADEPSRFFIILLEKDGKHTGHGVVFDEDRVGENPDDIAVRKVSVSDSAPEPSTYQDVLESFASIIGTYRKFLQFTMSVAPMISNYVVERTIGEFAKSKGTKRLDLSTDDRTVFELNINTYRQYSVHRDEIVGALKGAELLPEVMLIGLVSTYDSFLGKLLKVVILQHESMILTSEKTIKFSELSQFRSIEEARLTLIDREIESVLRESHQEHFRWMENKFSIKLKVDLPAFPKFIEICERRNLLTHTGGLVSAKYIDNCIESKISVDGIKIGDKLSVDNEYYSAAVDVICEIGVKLCWVLWRKFSKDERLAADRLMNEFCYDLVVHRQYRLAESLLSFTYGVLKKGGNDSCRRMMIINWANAMRLQKREGDAVKLLDGEDWSAVSDEFAISVAAVRDDVDGVVRLMHRIGSAGIMNPEHYRTWPVFRRTRTDARFKAAFNEVFGMPVILPESEPNEADDEKFEPNAPTKH